MSHFLRLFTLLAVLLLVWSPAQAALPAARAIALQPADLPARTSLLKRFTQYYSSSQLNADTVPYGLSPRALRSLGFRGLYTQGLIRPHDESVYSWQYLAFGTPAAAHRTYLQWARAFKYPFNQPAGRARVGNEGRYYNVVAFSAGHVALLVRTGRYVVLGHFHTRAALTRLMQIVVRRAHGVRSQRAR